MSTTLSRRAHLHPATANPHPSQKRPSWIARPHVHDEVVTTAPHPAQDISRVVAWSMNPAARLVTSALVVGKAATRSAPTGGLWRGRGVRPGLGSVQEGLEPAAGGAWTAGCSLSPTSGWGAHVVGAVPRRGLLFMFVGGSHADAPPLRRAAEFAPAWVMWALSAAAARLARSAGSRTPLGSTCARTWRLSRRARASSTRWCCAPLRRAKPPWASDQASLSGIVGRHRLTSGSVPPHFDVGRDGRRLVRCCDVQHVAEQEQRTRRFSVPCCKFAASRGPATPRCRTPSLPIEDQ